MPKAKKSEGRSAPGDKAEGKAARPRRTSGAEGVTLGIIPLPRQASRVIELPGDGLQFILLEHAIEMIAAEVFSMYTVKHTNVICVTRNADLDATEGCRRARRGLPRAHEAHPEEAQPPGPGAPGKRAAALDAR